MSICKLCTINLVISPPNDCEYFSIVLKYISMATVTYYAIIRPNFPLLIITLATVN